jgi:ubiquinone/menaquinone biosynthesis C-methylase UbiE
MDPQMIAQHLRKPEGEEGIAVGKRMNEGNLHMHQHFLEFLHLDDEDRVLEIGFGNGKFIPEILAKAQNVLYSGIDFSNTMVEEAIKLIEQEKLGVQAEVKLGSVSNIQYPENYFHKVITLNTIYFWPNPEEDAKEIRRVLKNQGELYVCFRPKEMAEKLPATQFGFKLYTLEDALNLLRNAGFTDLTFSYKEEPEKNVSGNKLIYSSYCIKAIK